MPLLAEMLEVKTPPPEPTVIDVAPEIWQACVGAYQLSADTTLHVEVEDGKPHFSADGQQWGWAYAESETRFFGQGDDTRVESVVDGAGPVTGLKVETQGVMLPAQWVSEVRNSNRRQDQ